MLAPEPHPFRDGSCQDGSDILIEWYENEPYDEYDSRRSIWVLWSRQCWYRGLKYKETLQTLLSLIEE
jgi:hypothetical protein